MFETVSICNLLSFLNQNSSVVISTFLSLGLILGFIYWYKDRNLKKRQIEPDINIENIDFRSFIELMLDKKHFQLSCNIHNKNPASGSIIAPCLLIRYPDSRTEVFQAKLDKSNSTLYNLIETEEESIYLKGGEIRQITLYYYVPSDTALLDFNINEPKYSIRYTDYSGMEHELPLELKSGEYLDD